MGFLVRRCIPEQEEEPSELPVRSSRFFRSSCFLAFQHSQFGPSVGLLYLFVYLFIFGNRTEYFTHSTVQPSPQLTLALTLDFANDIDLSGESRNLFSNSTRRPPEAIAQRGAPRIFPGKPRLTLMWTDHSDKEVAEKKTRE